MLEIGGYGTEPRQATSFPIWRRPHINLTVDGLLHNTRAVDEKVARKAARKLKHTTKIPFQRLRMVPGFPAYDWWVDPPDEVLLKAYIFNVTNAEAFLNGTDRKLKMEEVGPFVYSERLKHTDVVFNDNGTLTYTATRSAVFMPELSVNVSLNHSRLVVPNLALLVSIAHVACYGAFCPY